MQSYLYYLAARIRPIFKLATLAAALGMPLCAAAAEITWQTPTDIAAGSEANTTRELILTVAVRAGSTFAGTPSPTVTVDGVTYAIQGSLNLSAFTAPVTELATALTPAQSGLPDITGSGWEYHSFILSGSEGLPGKGFLRAKAEGP